MLAPNQILTAAQMRAAEAMLIAGGETVETLMERAGRGAADYVFRIAAGRRVTVLCGPGNNNGGDGYVIARVLAQRGVPVAVVAPLAPATDAAKAARALYHGEIVDAPKGEVLVDCLFGTGLTRGLDAGLHALLRDLAASHPYRIAVDLPSGVDADARRELNDGLPDYHLTLTLGAWKWAHWLMPAALRMGELRLIDIGIQAVDGAGQVAERAELRAPPADAHKYTRGLLAVVGGEMPGAARLAARSAMHGGAGYVKLLADASGPDELVTDSAALGEALTDPRLSAILVGPGLGRGKPARERLRHCIAAGRPLVIDADALHLLEPGMLGSEHPLVVTPHAGELDALSRAFGIPGDASNEALIELAGAMDAVVVAKGPVTRIAAPSCAIEVHPRATSWLSTAGTGDVLAGLIASRLATGETAQRAASEGCQLHAEAARLAGPGFSAGTLIEYIPAAYANFL